METDNLSKTMAEIILQHVRNRRGRLTMVSDMCGINRSEFCVDKLTIMRFYRSSRLLYILLTVITYDEFKQMMDKLWKTVQDTYDEYETLLLKE